jgi:ABC-2 type transport system permease protein
VDVRDAIGTTAALVGASVRGQMQYRASFVIRSLLDFGLIVADLVPVLFLVQRFGLLQGWSFAELALLYGMVGLSWGVVELSLQGFENFGTLLVGGRLDPWLLRPRSIVLQVATHEFLLRKLGRCAQAALVLALAGAVLGLAPGGWAWVALGVAGGAAFFAGILLVGAATQFWTLGQTGELQNALTYGGTFALTFPVSIYSTWLRRVVTWGIPLAFVNYFPALAALGRTAAEGHPAWTPWLSPFACGATLAAGLALFSAGLRRYESTGT